MRHIEMQNEFFFNFFGGAGNIFAITIVYVGKSRINLVYNV